MIEVKFEYSFWYLFRRNRKISVPSGWRELNSVQFLSAARLYLGTISDDKFMMQFFSLPKRIVKRLDAFQKYKLIEQVEYLRDARIPHSDFFMSRIPGTSLYSPGIRLNGMCLQQFMTVDTYFSRYLINENKEFLDMMVASLYLKKNERFVLTGEPVPSLFHHNTKLLNIEDRLPAIKKLDEATKYAVLLNFILIKKWLGGAYPHLFAESDEPQQKPNSKQPKLQKSVNWLEIFDNFVGDNIPEMEKYQGMAATDAFRILNRRIKEAKKHGNK